MKPVSFFSRILNLIAPRACCVCGGRLSIGEEVICSTCNLRLPRTDYARQPLDNEMVRLLWGHFPVQRCAAFFIYENHSQTAAILYDLKYHHRPEIGHTMGRMIGEEFLPAGFFDGIDALVPVPLTKRRQRQRGYNQSAEIARGISTATGLPVILHAVTRDTFQDSQTQKNFWERRNNVEGVFRLADTASVRGKHLLLVDDVLTTGSTITACARELLKAPDVTISILTLAFAKS